MAARLVVLVDAESLARHGHSEVSPHFEDGERYELFELEVDLDDYPAFDLESANDRRALQRVIERFLEGRYE